MRNALLSAGLLTMVPAFGQNNGPDAPEVTFTYEAPTGFHVALSNSPGSNNAGNAYVEAILPAEATEDPYWRMQGYILYQFNSNELPEDLVAAIHDPTMARPVLGLDLDDDIEFAVDTYDPTGASTCGTWSWYLANTGLDMEFYAVMDPFTSASFVQGEEYCFLVLAFAYNPYHTDAECDTEDQMLLSSRRAIGALELHCVVADPFAGLAENEAGSVFQVYPNPATSELRLRFPDAGQRYLRILDARGAVCATRAVRSEEPVAVDGLAAGVYALEVTGTNGRAVQRITIE